MNKAILHQPLEVFFTACMYAIIPARRRGLFGTPEEPHFYASGDAVPWHIEARWPLHGGLTFHADVETYFEDGYQVVRPLATLADDEAVMFFDPKGWYGLLVGAPTHVITTPRPRRPVGWSSSFIHDPA
jgi:hypothetical protein